MSLSCVEIANSYPTLLVDQDVPKATTRSMANTDAARFRVESIAPGYMRLLPTSKKVFAQANRYSEGFSAATDFAGKSTTALQTRHVSRQNQSSKRMFSQCSRDDTLRS
jgi:hypothetical protein